MKLNAAKTPNLYVKHSPEKSNKIKILDSRSCEQEIIPIPEDLPFQIAMLLQDQDRLFEAELRHGKRSDFSFVDKHKKFPSVSFCNKILTFSDFRILI